MVGTRRPGKGQNMEINEKHALSEMYTNAYKVTKNWSNSNISGWNWYILNEKMTPDVTITVPELEIDKKYIGHQYFYEETSGPCTHKPSNSSLFSKKLSGASPYMEFS
jgi:hypothetical protein